MRIFRLAFRQLVGLSLIVASVPALAQSQAPTVVEAICLEGGRPARLCACAENRLFRRLGNEEYAQYEAVSQAYLANREGGWPAAAQDVAAITGGKAETILAETRQHGQAHREEIQDCTR